MAKRGRPRKNKQTVRLADEQRKVELTPKQSDLLEVLRDPDNANLSNKELSVRAGINYATYYKMFRNPDFCKAVKQECLGKVYEGLLKVTTRVMQHAEDANLDKGHPWVKLALQMGGMVSDGATRQEVSTPTQINFVVNFERPKIIPVDSSDSHTEGEIIDAEVNEGATPSAGLIA